MGRFCVSHLSWKPRKSVYHLIMQKTIEFKPLTFDVLA